jgi:predicted transcriptional regulator
MGHKITIVRVRKNPSRDVNQELQWLGNSLGLFNQRDKDSSCFRVFITLVRKAKRSETMSSDEIAERLHLTRGTVVHHLAKLIDAGIVVREKQGYLLRENTLQNVIRDIQRDMEVRFAELFEVAKEIDDRLG